MSSVSPIAPGQSLPEAWRRMHVVRPVHARGESPADDSTVPGLTRGASRDTPRRSSVRRPVTDATDWVRQPLMRFSLFSAPTPTAFNQIEANKCRLSIRQGPVPSSRKQQQSHCGIGARGYCGCLSRQCLRRIGRVRQVGPPSQAMQRASAAKVVTVQPAVSIAAFVAGKPSTITTCSGLRGKTLRLSPLLA